MNHGAADEAGPEMSEDFYHKIRVGLTIPRSVRKLCMDWLSSTLRPTIGFHDHSRRSNFSKLRERATGAVWWSLIGTIAWVWIDDDDIAWKKALASQCIQSFWIRANSIYRWNYRGLTKSDTSATEETHGHLKRYETIPTSLIYGSDVKIMCSQKVSEIWIYLAAENV